MKKMYDPISNMIVNVPKELTKDAEVERTVTLGTTKTKDSSNLSLKIVYIKPIDNLADNGFSGVAVIEKDGKVLKRQGFNGNTEAEVKTKMNKWKKELNGTKDARELGPAFNDLFNGMGERELEAYIQTCIKNGSAKGLSPRERGLWRAQVTLGNKILKEKRSKTKDASYSITWSEHSKSRLGSTNKKTKSFNNPEELKAFLSKIKENPQFNRIENYSNNVTRSMIMDSAAERTITFGTTKAKNKWLLDNLGKVKVISENFQQFEGGEWVIKYAKIEGTKDADQEESFYQQALKIIEQDKKSLFRTVYASKSKEEAEEESNKFIKRVLRWVDNRRDDAKKRDRSDYVKKYEQLMKKVEREFPALKDRYIKEHNWKYTKEFYQRNFIKDEARVYHYYFMTPKGVKYDKTPVKVNSEKEALVIAQAKWPGKKIFINTKDSKIKDAVSDYKVVYEGNGFTIEQFKDRPMFFVYKRGSKIHESVFKTLEGAKKYIKQKYIKPSTKDAETIKVTRAVISKANAITRKYSKGYIEPKELQNMYKELSAIGIETGLISNGNQKSEWYYNGKEVENSYFIYQVHKSQGSKNEYNIYFS